MKNVLLIATILLCALFGGKTSLWAQTFETSLDQGSSVRNNLPVYGYYGYSYSQSIILASEMSEDVQGFASQITKLSYFNVSGSLNNTDNWKVYIGSTDKTSFDNNTDWVSGSELTEVYSGNVTVSQSNSWIEIELDNEFLWDGESNLVIGVIDLQSGYASTSTTVTWGDIPVTTNRSLLYYSDINIPSVNNPIAANTRFSAIPKIKLEHLVKYCDEADLSGTQDFILDKTETCSNEPFTASFKDYATYANIEYQWQKEEGGNWVDIAGANTNTYASTTEEDLNLRLIVTCPSSEEELITESQTVTIKEIPTVNMNFHDVAFCPSNPVAIFATGAASYSWSPSEGLNQSSGAVINASPLNKTQYVVTGTATNGCQNTDTLIVTPITNLKAGVTYDEIAACSAPVDINIVASDLPTELPNNAHWEYQFLNEEDDILIDWGIDDSYILNALTDSVYAVKIAIRSSDCEDEVYTSSINKITIGFGGDAETIDYNCNNLGGEITVFNDFGQSTASPIYENDFNSAANDDGLTFEGSSSINEGRLIITPSITSQSGSVLIAPENQNLGNDNSMNVSFDMTLDQKIDNYGTGGADGLAYSFGDDIESTSTNLQNGRGSKLRLSFDSAENTSNLVGIYLIYGKTNSNAPTPTESTTLAYSDIENTWRNHTDVPVKLTLLNGKATLYVANAIIFEEVELPESYLTEDVSEWKHCFSATTGGDAMRHAVDNLNINSSNYEFGISSAGEGIPAEWQNGKSFNNLAPGSYDIWLRKDENGDCQKLIKTVEITNTNPIVDLGGDYTICEGDSVILDAGYEDAIYSWNNSDAITQTLTVTTSGTYAVQVTDSLGCSGIGATSVQVNTTPDYDENDLDVNQQGAITTLTITNTVAGETYDWNLGDGTTINGGPASIAHIYNENGEFEVTVTISNDCGEVTISKNVTVSTLGINDEALNNMQVYPNPAKDYFNIDLGEENKAEIQIIDINGRTIKEFSATSANTKVAVKGWKKGLYFVHIHNNNNSQVVKLIIM